MNGLNELKKFISYPLLREENFCEEAINFKGVFVHNLRLINPEVQVSEGIEEKMALMISFEVIIGKSKKIKVFLTPSWATILKMEHENDGWFEKKNYTLFTPEFDDLRDEKYNEFLN